MVSHPANIANQNHVVIGCNNKSRTYLTFRIVDSVEVIISYGHLAGEWVQSSTGTKVAQWLGVPYAAPPVDELRFSDPVVPANWSDIRRATTFGARCVAHGQHGDEDCLYLNVWSPGFGATKRPVMVYIHGGSFNAGTASTPDVSGVELAARGQVVVVTLNYRLGMFGFMYGGVATASGNQGLKDIVMALKFVRGNSESTPC